MNAQEMLDYAMGQLEGSPLQPIEQDVATDPDVAEQIQRLERSIRALVDDGEMIEAPRGLARRTMTFVAEHGVRRRSILEYIPVKVPFRWADVAVAASILVAGLLTLVPAMHRSRDRMDQAGCGFNLQQLGLGLAQYAMAHNTYPYGSADNPKSAVAHAGSFVAMLHEAGLLHDPERLDCPCNGTSSHRGPLPDVKTLTQIRLKDQNAYIDLLCWDYAYNVGYRRASGAPGPITASASEAIPLLADQPAHEDTQRILEGNSPNHGGRGQNVLYSDLHVRWHNTRQLGPHDDDMFLNDDHRPAPGVRLMDAALLPGRFPFAGK